MSFSFLPKKNFNKNQWNILNKINSGKNEIAILATVAFQIFHFATGIKNLYMEYNIFNFKWKLCKKYSIYNSHKYYNFSNLKKNYYIYFSGILLVWLPFTKIWICKTQSPILLRA